MKRLERWWRANRQPGTWMVDRLSRVAEGLEMSIAADDETDRRPDGWAEASQHTGRQGGSCGARRDLVSREESS